jgi:SAM-dependent methyltransferase
MSAANGRNLDALVRLSGPFPPVLDACCSVKGFWFDHDDDRAMFMDIREGEFETTKGALVVKPDVVADFTDMPFPDNTFRLVVFDPPHHTAKRFRTRKDNSAIVKRYGRLPDEWSDVLRLGFAECFRVLLPMGVLVFKWFDGEIPVKDVLALTPERPLFGHKSGKRMKTHWIAFLKPNATGEAALPAKENA